MGLAGTGMDVTSVLREQHAGIRRVFARAALPGRGRAGEFRRLVRGYLLLLGMLGWRVLRHAAREEREEFPVLDRLGPARRRGA